ncbi:ribonuclease H family protein [Nocardia seriolae]|uniref:ribonuclease H n=1 Tax=Nocardia seriolae TaxID=37332 RepID=A0A0B8ND42_9NOCA|nr:ribonuclease H [Nocardia seriolae]APA94655.1 Ribonuclease H [Nocardia seriolae]MTJ66976.1 ribonuclease HI [Nocardia seriolae]MTJ72801.1 ribonuclease HI [Nocardia seriolae]MTJ84957.1 ribonuclease HI [Nocardia seriolae]MTK28953.1 ribonuclease HI [Nocardia seriolae]
MIIVSTDGSCLRNPGGAIGWAWVNHAGGSASGGGPSGTNQIAELRALLEAVRAHPGPEPLLIESDSLYAIKCASEWINGWRNTGWKTSTGAAVKNVELIQQIDRAIATRPGPVRFRWVRGHVGNYFNEQADGLAGQAARQAAASGLTTEPEAVDTQPEAPAPSDPVTEPLPITEPKTEPLPITKPAEHAEMVAAATHSAPQTPRRKAVAAKTTAPEALTLF